MNHLWRTAQPTATLSRDRELGGRSTLGLCTSSYDSQTEDESFESVDEKDPATIACKRLSQKVTKDMNRHFHRRWSKQSAQNDDDTCEKDPATKPPQNTVRTTTTTPTCAESVSKEMNVERFRRMNSERFGGKRRQQRIRLSQMETNDEGFGGKGCQRGLRLSQLEMNVERFVGKRR